MQAEEKSGSTFQTWFLRRRCLLWAQLHSAHHLHTGRGGRPQNACRSRKGWHTASTEAPWPFLGDDRVVPGREVPGAELQDRGKGTRRSSSVIHSGPSDGMTLGTTKQSTHVLGPVPWISGHSNFDSRVGRPLAE